MGASSSIAEQRQCPFILDMRSHEVAAHTSIMKALKHDYHGTQILLRGMLAEFEKKHLHATKNTTHWEPVEMAERGMYE